LRPAKMIPVKKVSFVNQTGKKGNHKGFPLQ
jgi:hypothetical protein